MIDPEVFEEQIEECNWKDKFCQKWIEFKLWLEGLLKKLGG